MSEDPCVDSVHHDEEGASPSDDTRGVQPRVGFWRKAWRGARSFFRSLKPGPRAWRGAGIGTLVAGGMAYLALALWAIVLARQNLAIYIIASVLPLLGLAAAGLGLLLLRLLTRLPSFYLWAVIFCIVMVGFAYGGLGPLGVFSSILACVLVGSLLGASLRIFAGRGWPQLSTVQRGVTAGGLIVGLAFAGFATWWLWHDGRAASETPNAALAAGVPVTPPAQELNDPSRPGSYNVLHLTYGSGSDRRRPEYGK